MKIFLALIIGVLIGAAGLWLYNQNRDNPRLRSAARQVEDAATSAKDAVQEKLRSFNLRTNDFKEELARTGQVVRRKVQQAGQAIADATADARITGAIKAKFLASRELSALSISVNTTGGVVTLSGSARSAEEISKAMLLAMETDGVREVISTLQLVKPRPGS